MSLRIYNSVLGNARTILWLSADFIKHGKFHTLPRQALRSLLHGIQLSHIRIRHDTDSLCTHVLKVHTNFLGGTRPESDTGRSHLKGILLLLRRVGGSSEVSTYIVGEANLLSLMVMMVAGVGVAGAIGWVGELDGAEKRYCSIGS